MKNEGGGGDYIYFSDTDVPVKTKGEPKAGAGFLTNYEPKSGANHKSGSRGVLNSLCISLEQICWFSIDY